MQPSALHCAYFSPTGTSRRVLEAIGTQLSQRLQLPLTTQDFTLPEGRIAPLHFPPGSLVLLATPVYAGRVPNLLLPFVQRIEAKGTLCVPVVLYGNRAYDSALLELKNSLEASGGHSLGAAAFIGEHSFGQTLAGGRPDAEDLSLARAFGNALAEKCLALGSLAALTPLSLPTQELGPYYRPPGPNGSFVDIRRVKPETDKDRCVSCFFCTEHCPLGSISQENPAEIPGICIKCNACVKLCPREAKAFRDPDYLFHKNDIAARYATPRKKPALFL